MSARRVTGKWPSCRGGFQTQLFQLIAILATAKLPEDRLSRAVFVLIRVAQTQSCWQMARSMRASVPFEGDHYGRTWANQLRNTPFRRISWSRWFQTRPIPTQRRRPDDAVTCPQHAIGASSGMSPVRPDERGPFECIPLPIPNPTPHRPASSTANSPSSLHRCYPLCSPCPLW